MLAFTKLEREREREKVDSSRQMEYDRFVIRVLIACVFLVSAWSDDEERIRYAPGLKVVGTVGSIGFIIGGGITSAGQLIGCWFYLTPTLSYIYNSGISDPKIFIMFTQNLVILCYLLWVSRKAIFFPLYEARNKSSNGLEPLIAEKNVAAKAAEGSPPMAATVKV